MAENLCVTELEVAKRLCNEDKLAWLSWLSNLQEKIVWTEPGAEPNVLRALVRNQVQDIDREIQKDAVTILTSKMMDFTTQRLQGLLSKQSDAELLKICIDRFNVLNSGSIDAELIEKEKQNGTKSLQIELTRTRTIGGEDFQKLFPNLKNDNLKESKSL